MNTLSRPPKPPQPPTTLSSLTTAFPRSLTVILLGVEGPKEVTLRATSTRTLVTNLLLCDETHEGKRLSLWGRCALAVTQFRILDIIHITKVYSHTSGELRLRHDGAIKRLVASNDTSTPPRGIRVSELLRFRTNRFPELCAMAERGRLLSREWISESVETRDGNGGNENGDIREFEGIKISCIRIRLPRNSGKSEIEAMRALCRRVCSRCMKRVPRGMDDGNVRCACGSSTNWGFGWLLLGLKGVDISQNGRFADSGNDPLFVVVEGDALARLLFAADVKRIVEDNAFAHSCYSILETLVKDGGSFRVVLRVGNGRPRLLDLQV